jgi:hypothetical protein
MKRERGCCSCCSVVSFFLAGVVSHVQALARGDHAGGWSGVEGQKEADKANQDNVQSLASKIMESTLTAHSATPIGCDVDHRFCPLNSLN